MENNLKPQSTGGLKLMTVFVAVLALHVLVIGGVSIYYALKGGSADTDLTDNKAPKDAKIAADGSVAMDAPLPDGNQPDKTAAAESVAPAPAIEPTTPAETATAPTPAPVADASDVSTPTGPVITPPQPPAPEPMVASEPTATTEPSVATEPTVESEPASAPPIEPETPVAPAPDGSYVVKMHDTLAKIAHRHHTTVAKLKTANGLHGELLHVGERLVMPGRTEVAAVPSGPTTSSTVLSGTPAATSDGTAATRTHWAAHTGRHTYTVVKGDTLTRIAHKFRTTAKALMVANNITDPTRLSIGKKLRIPSREAQATTTVAPARAPVSVPDTVRTTATPAPTPAPAPVPNAVQPEVTAQLANFVQ